MGISSAKNVQVLWPKKSDARGGTNGDKNGLAASIHGVEGRVETMGSLSSRASQPLLRGLLFLTPPTTASALWAVLRRLLFTGNVCGTSGTGRGRESLLKKGATQGSSSRGNNLKRPGKEKSIRSGGG